MNTSPKSAQWTHLLKKLAEKEGFATARIADAKAPWEASRHLSEFIAQGHHGDMKWLEDERRSHPLRLWPEAQSALVLGMNYAPPENPLAKPPDPETGNISVYARNADYHDIIKKKLKRIARTFAQASSEQVKLFVDTAALMEKPLAMRAGLGWQGKHSNLVSRQAGSWLFLAVILTTARLDPDPAGQDHCGQCRACLDICPTKAFTAPYRLDARRCISYLTIEHKGSIDPELRAGIGNRIFGCDDCLAVCPWNKFAATAAETAFQHRQENIAPALDKLVMLDETAFRHRFAKSPIKRTGRERFIRNVLIAIGNSKKPHLAPSCRQLLDDPSPLIRGAAIWTLSQLTPKDIPVLHSRYSKETDETVKQEWIMAQAAAPPATSVATLRL